MNTNHPTSSRGIVLGLITLIIVALALVASAQTTPAMEAQVTQLVGKWNVEYSHGVKRVFEITAGRNIKSIGDRHGPFRGVLKPGKDGKFDAFLTDKNLNRIQLIDANTIKIEYYEPAALYKSGALPNFTAKGTRVQ